MWDENREEPVTPPWDQPSGAPATGAPAPDGHIYFPVHVVVVGGIGEDARAEIEDRIWAQLHAALG